jgi:hypothetical protein
MNQNEITQIGNHKYQMGIYSEDNGASYYSQIEHLESGLTASLDALKYDNGFIDDTGNIFDIEKWVIDTIDCFISDMFLTIES